MDTQELLIRQVAAKCTAQELNGVMGAIEEDRKERFDHYLKLIKGQ